VVVTLASIGHFVNDYRVTRTAAVEELTAHAQLMLDSASTALTFDEGSTDPTGGIFEGNDPSHLVSARSYLDLPRGLAFDAVFRFTGRRPTPVVRKYAELDLRAGWTVRPSWELSIVGQNLLHERHQELVSPNTSPFSFRRSVFARSLWRF
jgi:hypothetical protein